MDYTTYIRFVAALVFVLALIGAITWLVRRLGLAERGLRNGGRNRRLAVVETLAIDARRRLVLVRHDQTEHLIMIGGTADLVVAGPPGNQGATPAAPAAATDGP
ncbi:MAG: FliO/MopB family protein [Rhodospirillales bacterium]